jgi:hypothetical protein
VTGVYRDPSEGLRARLADLVKQVQRRETTATVIFWSCLAQEHVKRLHGLRAAAFKIQRQAASFTEISRAIEALESYLTALDDLLAQADKREAELCALPEEPPTVRPWISQSAEPSNSSEQAEVVERVYGALKRQISSLDPGHHWDLRWTASQVQVRTRFRADDTPLLLDHVHTFSSPQRSTFRLFPDHLVITTGVARATPSLRLSPAGLFGGWRGIKLGDPSFDGMFVVIAERDHARLLLTRDVRTDLLTIARFEIPSLRVESMAATLSWRFEPKVKAVAAAIRVLAALRRAPVAIGLLNRGEPE